MWARSCFLLRAAKSLKCLLIMPLGRSKAKRGLGCLAPLGQGVVWCLVGFALQGVEEGLGGCVSASEACYSCRGWNFPGDTKFSNFWKIFGPVLTIFWGVQAILMGWGSGRGFFSWNGVEIIPNMVRGRFVNILGCDNLRGRSYPAVSITLCRSAP